MRVRELRGTNVTVIEREDDRWFIEDLFAIEEAGEHIPLLDEDASDFTLFDEAYRPVTVPMVIFNLGRRE